VAVFPAFLKLAGRKVLVVGGGPMAAAKVAALWQAGAEIHLVTPAICPAMDLTEVASVVRREFRPDDLDGMWLVVAAVHNRGSRGSRAAPAVRQRRR